MECGPVNAQELKELAEIGVVTTETLVSRDSGKTWKTANRLKGLFPKSIASAGSNLLSNGGAKSKVQSRCGDCGALIAVPQIYAGKQIRCKKCGGAVSVPLLEPGLEDRQKASIQRTATTEPKEDDAASNEHEHSKQMQLRDVSAVPASSTSRRQPENVDINRWNVEQLDTMEYIVDDIPFETAFTTIAKAAAISHEVRGAFARSGIIRGAGNSGITFVITVKEQEGGAAFEIDGETPDGPVNFDAWFDPTTAGGWGLFAVTSLFNSAVNTNAEESVEHDTLLLLYNILNALGAEHLLPDDDKTNRARNDQAAITQGNVNPQQRSLPESGRSFDAYPRKYATEYAKIYNSNESYKGSFNLMAFLFGPLWALSKGLWFHAILATGIIMVTVGVMAIPMWFYTGFRGTYLLYCKDVKAQQKGL